jgi:prolyl-tRNA synthetase
VGVSRLVGAVIEASHDDKGIIWPATISPFDAGIVNLKVGHAGTDKITEQLYQEAKAAGFDILLDDSSDSAGAKLASMDLIGLPWQVIAGPRLFDKGAVEIKNRKTGVSEEVGINQASARLLAALSS